MASPHPAGPAPTRESRSEPRAPHRRSSDTFCRLLQGIMPEIASPPGISIPAQVLESESSAGCRPRVGTPFGCALLPGRVPAWELWHVGEPKGSPFVFSSRLEIPLEAPGRHLLAGHLQDEGVAQVLLSEHPEGRPGRGDRLVRRRRECAAGTGPARAERAAGSPPRAPAGPVPSRAETARPSRGRAAPRTSILFHTGRILSGRTPSSAQNLLGHLALLVDSGGGGVHDVQHEVRVADLGQRRAEGGDERRRQLPHEADRVDEDDVGQPRRAAARRARSRVAKSRSAV